MPLKRRCLSLHLITQHHDTTLHLFDRTKYLPWLATYIHGLSNDKNVSQANDNRCSVHRAYCHLPVLDYERTWTQIWLAVCPRWGRFLAIASFAVSWNRPPLAQQQLVQLKAADEPEEHCWLQGTMTSSPLAYWILLLPSSSFSSPF